MKHGERSGALDPRRWALQPALEYAIRVASPDATAAQIVAEAGIFFAYLTAEVNA